ncbi:MAG: alpha/beta hydrolase [Sphingobium sp.]
MEPTDKSSPLILTIPGLDNSGPSHWQSLWEGKLPNCHRVDIGMWDAPHRNTWVNKLNLAIHRVNQPVILVAHSLGCHLVAWWAALERPAAEGHVLGALLVAPPDVEKAPVDKRVTPFAPTPKNMLPFPSIVVGSHNDPYHSFEGTRTLANYWGSSFADAGRSGHINGSSNVGDWAFGKSLLNKLSLRGEKRGERLAKRFPMRDSIAANWNPVIRF